MVRRDEMLFSNSFPTCQFSHTSLNNLVASHPTHPLFFVDGMMQWMLQFFFGILDLLGGMMSKERC